MGARDLAPVTGLQRLPPLNSARVGARKAGSDAPPAEDAVHIEDALDALLDAGAAPQLHFQPIVDLAQRRVVGFEALSRFSGPPAASPDKWFAAAERIGRSVELEALVIANALGMRERLPADCFLSINVAPSALLAPSVRALLRGRPLSRVVVELTEHSAVADYDLLRRAVGEVRELGAFVAVDDAGAGYASLQHVLALRPDFVKLDRSLICGLQHDEAKAALVEMFGGFTSRIDAWLLAEGIEEQDELTRLCQLGVPLGQGYLLGRPAPQMVRALDPQIAAVSGAKTSGVACVTELAELHATMRAAEADSAVLARLDATPQLESVLLLDPTTRPVGLARRTSRGRLERRGVLCVLEQTPVKEALKRALTRERATRFDPIVCCDARGHYRGVVRIERMCEALM